MSFLPIVQRELRAASRRRSTYRVRWWTALIALLITLFGLGTMALSRGLRGGGSALFGVLTAYAFFLCLLAGVLLTADAVAQERREGTLGLLFLTDLKGYDIILGKFFAHSLNAFYALLAVLPAAALPLLLGGLEGAEFFRMSLALLNALCLSAAAGIFVSALSRESQHALSNGLGLVILLAGIFPLVAAGSRWVGVAPAWQLLAWLSPFSAYAHAEASSYVGREGTFWGALALSHLLGWVLLVIASLVLPRVFQDKPRRVQPPVWPTSERRPSRTRTARGALLSENPILWLRGSELGTPWAAWLVVVLWGVTVGVILVLAPGSAASPGSAISTIQVQLASIFGFSLKLFFALHACRFFVDARRDGTLELLLCTPLSNQDIIQGQMKALWRSYRWPVIVLLALLFLPLLLRLWSGAFQLVPGPLREAAASTVLAGVFALRMGADVLAILWFGTALALTSRRPSLAPAWTVLFVLVLPAPLSFCWLDILIDIGLISWGTNKCRLDLRRLVAEQYQAFAPPTRQAPHVARHH